MSLIIEKPLTAAQRRQLEALLAAGATSGNMAVGPYAPALRMCSPLVLGKLRDLELVSSRVVRAGGWRGSQFTAYWLTPTGAAVARQIACGTPAERMAR